MPLRAPRRTHTRAPLRVTVDGSAPTKMPEPDYSRWVPRDRADDVPLRMHAHRMAPGPIAHLDAVNYGGSLEWSPEFTRWLSTVVVTALIEDHLPYSRWHESPYVVSRLKALLGDVVVDAVLAYQHATVQVRNAAERAEWDESEYRWQYQEWAAAALAPFGYAVGWAERLQRRIWNLARGPYQLVDVTHRTRRASARVGAVA